MGRAVRRTLRLTTAAVAALAVAAPQAMAGTDHYFSNGLSPGRLFASASAHSGIYYMQAIKNHRACIGLSLGWAGYAPPGSGTYYNYNCTDGSALVFAYPGSPPDFYHSAVYNPNASTNVSVADAHYSW